MANSVNWLKIDSIPISKDIVVKIPKVGEVLDNEEVYLSLTSSLTASSYTYMVQLDDMGKDFTQVSDWELFRMIFCGYSNQVVKYKTEIKNLLIQAAILRQEVGKESDEYAKVILAIKYINNLIDSMGFQLIFEEFELASEDSNGNIIGFIETDDDNGEKILFNTATGVEINQLNYVDITDAIRKINLYEKVTQKPGNEHAKNYLLEKERRRQKRLAKRKKKFEPYIENIVVALVNDANFPYDYESCMELSLYKFNRSFKQIHHRINFDNTMIGIYSGTVDASKMTNKDCLSWYQLNK